MLELCKKYEVSVIMDSDAHIDADVGNHKYVYEILQQSGFPEELVVNTDADKFRRYLKHH
jgi:putative hydrolase